jgi:hypothetical protein
MTEQDKRILDISNRMALQMDIIRMVSDEVNAIKDIEVLKDLQIQMKELG